MLTKITGLNTYFVVFVVNLLSFLCGISLAWPSPILPKLQHKTEDYPFDRDITETECSWISSLLSMGGMAGPFFFGYLAEKFGRRIAMTSLAVPFVTAYAILAGAKTVPLYMFARVLAGISAGGCFAVQPMYIGEVSSDSNRGMLSASSTSFIMMGLLFSYCLGPYVSIFTFNLVICILAAICIPLNYIFCCESPYYLITVGKSEEALKSLKRLRGVHNIGVSEELDKVIKTVNSSQKGSFKDIFKSLAGLRAFFIGTAMLSLQQFSGITIILQYSQDIFEAANTSFPPAKCSIIIGAVEVCTCFIIPVFCDKAGRRTLLFISNIGGCISLAILGLYFYLDKQHNVDMSSVTWLPILALVMYILSYNTGESAVPWSLTSELYPMNIKTVGIVTSIAIYWLVGFLLTQFFTPISDKIGMGPSFWIFSGFGIVIVIFVFIFVFETKGKSLQEIQDILNSHHQI